LSYTISTARNGVGELSGSECTPRGRHIIRAKIGYDAVINSVFVGRRQTGEIYHPVMREEFPKMVKKNMIMAVFILYNINLLLEF
jgi:L,D-transpeptidase YbiS